MRSVPICDTDVRRRVLRVLRSRETKADGVPAVARANSVVWQRKPMSMSSCFFVSGFANLRSNIFVERS